MLLDRAPHARPSETRSRAHPRRRRHPRPFVGRRAEPRPGVAASLESRLALYDDGSRRARSSAPRATCASSPIPRRGAHPGALPGGRRGAPGRDGRRPVPLGRPGRVRQGTRARARNVLPPRRLPARYPTVYPLLVRRGGSRNDLRWVVLPRRRCPGRDDGMSHGWYGSSDDEDSRGFLTHQPMHDVEVGAFLIAQRVVTNGDYLAYLEALTPAERAGSTPPTAWSSRRAGASTWQLREPVVLLPGEPLCTEDGCVDWSRPSGGRREPRGRASTSRSGSRDRVTYAARGSAPIAGVRSARREEPTSGSTRTAIPRLAPKDAARLHHPWRRQRQGLPLRRRHAPCDAKPLRRRRHDGERVGVDRGAARRRKARPGGGARGGLGDPGAYVSISNRTTRGTPEVMDGRALICAPAP